jgi:hypothetical protein
MRKLVFITAIVTILVSCEKSNNSKSSAHTAKVAGYNLNCSTCILEFPYDSLLVMESIGKSIDNLYNAVNLNKNSIEIGQMMKVEIRKAQNSELTPCITLYPSFSYQNVFITEAENFDSFNFNDTILIACKDCAGDPENQRYICFDEVVSDSRCPSGAQCVWAGAARVRLKYEKPNEKSVIFDLNTIQGGRSDTIIDGFKFSLLNVLPYPSLGYAIEQKDYKAEILIEPEAK